MSEASQKREDTLKILVTGCIYLVMLEEPESYMSVPNIAKRVGFKADQVFPVLDAQRGLGWITSRLETRKSTQPGAKRPLKIRTYRLSPDCVAFARGVVNQLCQNETFVEIAAQHGLDVARYRLDH